jgi:hypothetical protein
MKDPDFLRRGPSRGRVCGPGCPGPHDVWLTPTTLTGDPGGGLKRDVLVCWEVEEEVKVFSQSSGGEGARERTFERTG